MGVKTCTQPYCCWTFHKDHKGAHRGDTRAIVSWHPQFPSRPAPSASFSTHSPEMACLTKRWSSGSAKPIIQLQKSRIITRWIHITHISLQWFIHHLSKGDLFKIVMFHNLSLSSEGYITLWLQLSKSGCPWFMWLVMVTNGFMVVNHGCSYTHDRSTTCEAPSRLLRLNPW